MATKKTKTALVKKAAKKKSAAKKVAPPLPPEEATIDDGGVPCICVKANGRWFCMKEENGMLMQCDGPFATKAECEEHTCS